MDQQVPLKAKVYILILFAAAVVLCVYAALQADWATWNWFAFLVFLLLTFLSDSFPVTMPRGGIVSVGFAALFASILLFEPFIVILISVLGDFFSLRKGRSTWKYVFNAAQLAIALGASSLIYRLINQGDLVISLNSFYAVITSLILCFLLNSSFVTLVLAFIHNRSPYSLWVTNIKWSAPNFLSMAPLGILIALIYGNIGFWGLVLFLVPLILARHSFQSYVNMRQVFLDTIQSLSVAIDAKDHYTKGHSSRVGEYAVDLARELRWPEDKVEQLQYVALIHDVGKIAVSELILKKESNLTEDEHMEMARHPVVGAEVIKNIKFFADGAILLKHHHERWDGTGYPDHLKEEQIPEGSRILAVADAFDAMTSDRPYRNSMSALTALQEIREGAGTQFDPKIVEAFTHIFPRFKRVMEYSYPADTFYDESAASDAAADYAKLKQQSPGG